MITQGNTSKELSEQDVPVNNIGGGEIASFDPKLRSRKKKLKDILRRVPPCQTTSSDTSK